MTAPAEAGAPARAPGRLEEVADATYAYIQPEGGWCVSNAGILLEPGRGGRPVLVDTAATLARARALRAALHGLTPERPRLIVNTHFHGDHTFGNAELAGPDTVVVAHERTRTEMAAAGLGLTGLWPSVDWGDIQLMLPELTFRQGLTLHQGDRVIELIHPGPAHTTNDTLVWLPRERVLFAGDVVLPGCTPFVLMGSVAGSLDTLRLLRELEPLTVVGGHGPVSGPEALAHTEEYFLRLQETAAQGRAAGLTPLQLAREAGPGEFAGLLDPERLVANLHRAYSELAGDPLGHELDVIGIFGEMVEYNGGVLPRTHA
ncbi:MBL fold metallo-hydrolase [Streptomyces fulvorobeus]|uniref:Cyclase n=1 Tax=Streptomyces fulvorobeus TaxID=284028 RepID=A0A7J0CCP8_9ACTN|nr:MBL fold metallo-hydrolase [Streptomyces fulvorobeus]NYE43804.1 cyclase [Streptomyces fulvorobeus]GFN00291.1 MBL fold metallo-hydrolase [Streptomyces fulvorobeus]